MLFEYFLGSYCAELLLQNQMKIEHQPPWMYHSVLEGKYPSKNYYKHFSDCSYVVIEVIELFFIKKVCKGVLHIGKF